MSEIRVHQMLICPPPSSGKNGTITKNKLEKKKMIMMGFGALKGGSSGR
jgi:hypothetical protein